MKKSNSAAFLQPHSAADEARKSPAKSGNKGKAIQDRASRADLPRALAILKKAGKDNPVLPGDELPGR